jgi:hypothetical protein
MYSNAAAGDGGGAGASHCFYFCQDNGFLKLM